MRTGTSYKLFLLAVLTLLAVLFSNISKAQDVKATAKLDNNAIQIGQQVKLSLSIKYRVDKGKTMKVEFPELNDTIRKEIEIVDPGKTDTIVDKNDPYLFTQTKTLTITSFDSGYWAIPPFKFTVNGDTAGVLTDPMLLQVTTVEVDTTKEIKDIKDIYTETYSWIDWLKDNMHIVYWSLAGLLVAAIAIYLIMRYNKRPAPVVVIEAPKIPAHIIAFGKLEQLKNDKLWQDGKLKLYHSTLTDILREYIENRFKIQAQEQTTDEIIFGFRNIAIDEESKMKLKRVLVLADLVKFAKEQPLANENELSLNYVYDFVNGTMRNEEETVKK